MTTNEFLYKSRDDFFYYLQYYHEIVVEKQEESFTSGRPGGSTVRFYVIFSPFHVSSRDYAAVVLLPRPSTHEDNNNITTTADIEWQPLDREK